MVKGEDKMSEEKEVKRKVRGGTEAQRKRKQPIESTTKKKGSTTAKKKVVGGTGAKRKVRGGTGAKRKRSLLDKTIKIGSIELSFSLKREVSPKRKKVKLQKEMLFPKFLTAIFVSLILIVMGYAIYHDLNGKV